MSWHFLLRRIALRSVLAIWRHRFVVLAGGVIALALGAYELGFAGPGTWSSGDCADSAMNAITHADDGAARAAFACLGPAMRNTSEDQFVVGMRDRAIPGAQFDRIADKRTVDGGHIVFFTVDSGQGGVAIGYIVYLDAEGKITHVE